MTTPRRPAGRTPDPRRDTQRGVSTLGNILGDACPSKVFDLVQIIQRTWVKQVYYYDFIGSTNDRAVQLAREPDVRLPALILANHQTRGRGRNDRRWESWRGALTFSLIVPVRHWPMPQRPVVSLAAGLAVAQTLEPWLHHTPISLKWPNDVYIKGGKVAGILIESPSSPADRLIVGIGINLNNSRREAPQGLAPQALSVCDVTAGRLDAQAVLIGCLQRLRGYLASPLQSARILDAWRHYDLLLGRLVTVQMNDGTLCGYCRGVDDQGALVLDTSEGIRRCYGGTVTVWNAECGMRNAELGTRNAET